VALLVVSSCTTDRRVGQFVDPETQEDGGGMPPDALLADSVPDDSGIGSPVADGGGDLPADASMLTPFFTRIPAGRELPDEATCAARIRQGGPEPRPDNVTFNQTIPPVDQVAMLTAFGGGRGYDSAAVPLGKRVSGNFTGTTDEILRWGACKWGFNEDFVRADAYQANGWHQAAVSGWTSNRSNCPTGGPTRAGQDGTECAQVFGMFGITWQFHKSSWPMVRDSTAFNIDYSLAVQRVCFEGLVAYMRGWGPPENMYGPNDEFGCAASFFTGGWYDFTTIQKVNSIRDTLAKKPWR
jgi:autotransporter family porin